MSKQFDDDNNMPGGVDRRINQSLVAKIAGVHRVTVTRALNGNASVSEATRKRILEAVARAGYRPNAASRAFRSGRFGTMTLLMPRQGWGAWFPKALLVGAMRELAEHHITLQLAEIEPDRAAEADAMPRVLREFSSDGLIILTAEVFPKQVADQIEVHHLPVVWANHNGSTDCVYPDEAAGMAELTRMTLRRGHARVQFVDRQPTATDAGGRSRASRHFSTWSLRQGYESAMRETGLAPASMLLWGGSPYRSEELERQKSESIRGLLSRADRPTAVVCGDARLAHRFILEAAMSGLRVPQDLSVVTRNVHVGQSSSIALTQFDVPWRAVGMFAARMLMEKVACGGDALAPITVPFEVRDGSTLGPPPQGGRHGS